MHCLRHLNVTHLLEAGYDPMFVQLQVGHAYSSTTALHTLVSADVKQQAIQRMIRQRIVTRDESGSRKHLHARATANRLSLESAPTNGRSQPLEDNGTHPVTEVTWDQPL
nr:hypothetical protein [Gordonia rubripertincta]